VQFMSIIWDMEDDPDGNVQHIALNNLSIGQVDYVLRTAKSAGFSRSSGRPMVWGHTPEGRYIAVVYQEVAEGTIRVVTAYDAPEPWRLR
jgi:uncharacterized DUF497 family protein